MFLILSIRRKSSILRFIAHWQINQETNTKNNQNKYLCDEKKLYGHMVIVNQR